MTATALESIISSRIRRILLEHVLAHPAERFYLRGLAKELNLSISPTRRELKRLERLGFLKVSQEANILFYHVDRTSPLFLQLTAALRSPVSEALPQAPPASAASPERSRGTPSEAVPVVAVKLGTQTNGSKIGKLFVSPIFEGVALSLIVSGVLAGVAYLAYTNQRLLLVTKQAVLTPKTQVTVVESPSASTASGTMRGTRWQLVPGGLGGVSNESY